MVESGNLLQYFFINENDVYYSGNLLKLNSKQFIWTELVRARYTDVVFLKQDGKGFMVSSYPRKDHRETSYSVANSALKKNFDNALEGWMENRTAVICSLEDFCEVMSGRPWKSALDLIRTKKGKWKGTIILTAPVFAEQSASLFMNSQVFDGLNESAVLDARKAKGKDLYSAIKQNKGNACRFLNVFTPETVENILLHIAFDKPSARIWDLDEKIAGEYLTQYLYNQQLQDFDPYFRKKGFRYDISFQDLYKALCQQEILNELRGRISDIQNCGSLQNYLDTNGILFSNDTDRVTICRERRNYAGKCLDLTIPYKEPIETDWIDAEKTLQEIRKRAMYPAAGTENHVLVQAIEELTDNMTVYKSAMDYDSWNRALYAIKTCFVLLYEDPGSEKGKNSSEIGEMLRKYVETSHIYFRQSKDLERFQKDSGKGELALRALRQMEEKTDSVRKVLERYQDLVLASLVNYSSNSNAEDISGYARALGNDIEKYEALFSTDQSDQENKTEQQEELFIPEEEIPQNNSFAEEEDDYSMYTIDDDDYDYLPPTLRN